MSSEKDTRNSYGVKNNRFMTLRWGTRSINRQWRYPDGEERQLKMRKSIKNFPNHIGNTRKGT